MRYLAILASLLVLACSTQQAIVKDQATSATPDIPIPSPPQEKTQILWDEWGVPHIYAQSNEELAFALGWAEMHSHANTILKLYGQSRGRAAEYWGAENLENDQIVHTLGFPKLAEKWLAEQDPFFDSYISNFAKGMNAYVAANPSAVKDKYQVVLPIENSDIFKHYLFVMYTRFIGGGEFGKIKRWDQVCLLYTSPSPRDATLSRMPSSA